MFCSSTRNSSMHALSRVAKSMQVLLLLLLQMQQQRLQQLLLLANRSSDDRRLVPAHSLLETRELQRNVGKRLDHIKSMHAQIPAGCHILLEVQPDRRPRDTGARQAEDDAGIVLEDEADALVFGYAAIHWVCVLKHVIPH